MWLAFLAAISAERIVELVLTRRNSAWAFARGGVEHGRGHYAWMAALHTGLLVACALEPWLLARPFLPALGYPALAAVLGAQGLRWWCIATLGPRWNTRVIVLPLPPITGGPYRFLRHPNYLAVTVEGLALPLVHSAWITAVGFTFLNAILLATRIRVEDRALGRT